MLNLSYPIRLLPILLWTLLIPAPATGEDVDQATFSVEMVRDIPYAQKHSPHPRQHLDLFVPRNTQKPTPVLVFVHGGSWRSGNKTFYLMLGRAFARQGILTAIIGYRLSPRYRSLASRYRTSILTSIRRSIISKSTSITMRWGIIICTTIIINSMMIIT